MAGVVIVFLLSCLFTAALLCIHMNHYDIPLLEKQKIDVWINLQIIHDREIDYEEVESFIDAKFPSGFEKQRKSYRNYIKTQAGRHYNKEHDLYDEGDEAWL